MLADHDEAPAKVGNHPDIRDAAAGVFVIGVAVVQPVVEVVQQIVAVAQVIQQVIALARTGLRQLNLRRRRGRMLMPRGFANRRGGEVVGLRGAAGAPIGGVTPRLLGSPLLGGLLAVGLDFRLQRMGAAHGAGDLVEHLGALEANHADVPQLPVQLAGQVHTDLAELRKIPSVP